MALTIDLNADLGEGIGSDDDLVRIVSSANVACGLHAGSVQDMRRTMAAALAQGVGIGAHPGFEDRANFGRTRQTLSAEDVTALIRFQVGASVAVAQGLGATVRHLKLHGALANMASEDVGLARICYQAARQLAPDLTLVVIAATAQEQAARELGAAWAGEIFADRAYNDDATLVDRKLPGAVLHDADAAASRVLTMLRTGAIVAQGGRMIPARIDTVCLHGDTPEAVDMARALRHHLEANGVTIARFA